MIVEQYFEDYEIDLTRRTLGRTLTEADIVTHAGQTGDFFPTTWMRSGARSRTSSGGLPTARGAQHRHRHDREHDQING